MWINTILPREVADAKTGSPGSLRCCGPGQTAKAKSNVNSYLLNEGRGGLDGRDVDYLVGT